MNRTEAREIAFKTIYSKFFNFEENIENKAYYSYSDLS